MEYFMKAKKYHSPKVNEIHYSTCTPILNGSEGGLEGGGGGEQPGQIIED